MKKPTKDIDNMSMNTHWLVYTFCLQVFYGQLQAGMVETILVISVYHNNHCTIVWFTCKDTQHHSIWQISDNLFLITCTIIITVRTPTIK